MRHKTIPGNPQIPQIVKMNKMNKIKYIISILFLIAGIVRLPASDALIAQADSAYKQNNFEEAAALYARIVETQGVSAGLLYNLGNTYYKLGKVGEARLCYERAKKIDPSTPEINQNLEFLSMKVTDANKGSLKGTESNVDPDQESFIQGLYRLIAINHSSNGWAILAIIAFILFLGGLALYMFTPNVLARKTGFFSGLTFLGFTVIFLIFAYLGAHQFERQDEAVLLDFTTELLEQPQEGSKTTSSQLHKGTKLKVLEVKEGSDGTEWMKVRLNSNNVGWLKNSSVEVIGSSCSKNREVE